MVEQIRISPEEVRGYGNVCEEHSLEDFIVSSSGLAKEKETVHGALTNVYKLVYSLYGLMFDFDNGNKQLYLQMGEADILSFGFDDDSKQLYLLDMARTGLSLGFDEDTNELYITDDAPPIVHNYTLALDSESYTTSGSLSVSATLLDNSVPVEGATISFTGGTSTVTATTDSSGVATATVNFTSSGTLTATYSNVSDTATVTVQQGYLFYDDCTSDRTSDYELLDVSGFRNSLATWSYDSANNCYNLGTGSYQNANYGLLVKNLTVGSCKITAKVQVNTTNNVQIGCGLHNNTDTTVQIANRLVKTNNTISIIRVNPDTTIANASQSLSTNTDYIIEFIYEDGDLTFNLYNSSNTLLKTLTGTTNLLSSNNNVPFVFFGYQSQQNAKLKEFKVEAL